MVAEKVQSAKALEESYLAEQKAETARAERERSTECHNIVFQLKLQNKSHHDAEAACSKIRLQGKGETDAIFAKMEAEAKVFYEILTKQAEGYDQIGAAGGDTNKCFPIID